MLYEFRVFKMFGSKRHFVSAREVDAKNVLLALERSCISMEPDRLVEIRMREQPFEMPCQRSQVRRTSRDAA